MSKRIFQMESKIAGGWLDVDKRTYDACAADLRESRIVYTQLTDEQRRALTWAIGRAVVDGVRDISDQLCAILEAQQ